MERRVGSGSDGALHVLLSERVLPQNLVRPDNRNGQARNACLDPQLFKVVSKGVEDKVLAVHRLRSQERNDNRHAQEATSHGQR